MQTAHTHLCVHCSQESYMPKQWKEVWAHCNSGGAVMGDTITGQEYSVPGFPTVYHCFMQSALQEGVGHLEGLATGATNSKHKLAQSQAAPQCFPRFWSTSSRVSFPLFSTFLFLDLVIWGHSSDTGVGVRPNANGFIKSDPADDASQFTTKLPQTKYFGSSTSVSRLGFLN